MEVSEQVRLRPEALDRKLRTYSKGMLQRIGLAQALLAKPRLVILDEPMSGLDPIGRREVRDLIDQLRKDGKTIFFSTHILSDAETLCDRIAVIHRGELRGIGSVAELTKNVQGKIEVAWHGSAVPETIRAQASECSSAGEIARAIIQEQQLDAVLDALRASRLRLISVTPVRSTLEEYFVQQMQAREGASA